MVVKSTAPRESVVRRGWPGFPQLVTKFCALTTAAIIDDEAVPSIYILDMSNVIGKSGSISSSNEHFQWIISQYRSDIDPS